MELGKILRQRRIFKDKRTVIVPIDHPLYFGPVPGLEDPVALVQRIAQAGADAVLLTPGILESVADVLGEMAVVLRIDGTHTRLGKHIERIHLISSVEEALRLGVEAVALNIFVGEDNEDVLLTKLGVVAGKCREYGMLLVGEMIPEPVLHAHYGKGNGAAPLTPEAIAEYIALAARCGAEIGVDIVKTNYSGSKESFRHVIQTATRPVLMAGGPKCGDDAAQLEMIRDAMDAGAAGVCVGRNVWQRKNVSGILRAIKAVVHENAPVEEALERMHPLATV